VYLSFKDIISLERMPYCNKINNQFKFGKEEHNRIRETGDSMQFISPLLKEVERKLLSKPWEVYLNKYR
jgi:hypothetical protein